MSAPLGPVLDDLIAESSELQLLLETLEPVQWSLMTPADGWTIADQVSHLAYFDVTTVQSLTDPEGFRRDARTLMAEGDDYPDRIAADHRHLDAPSLLDWYRKARSALIDAYAEVDPAARLPWYGPDMGPVSSVTARLMETWAHGQDIADTLGVQRVPSLRLRNIAHLGIRSLPYSYSVNGVPLPTDPIRVELTAPGGDLWSWGPDEATDVVRGEALDFCLVVTQRRHLDDTGLEIEGPTAGQWIGIAQAYAGPVGTGREPGSRT